MSSNKPNIKPGDRVLVKAKSHKWYGTTGTLTDEEMKPFPGMFRVNLDNGLAAGCYLSELEKL
jgi:translation initiation factor IF-1